jgi:hypothetical protein
MASDWLFRVGDGSNLKKSSIHKIWSLNTISPDGKFFIKNVKSCDRLWFIQSKSKGKIIAVATYQFHNKRDFGPLLNITMTDEELGWLKDDIKSDTEIHYTDLFNLSNCELLTNIKSAKTIRKYNDKCSINLPEEYNYIIRYSKITLDL